MSVSVAQMEAARSACVAAMNAAQAACLCVESLIEAHDHTELDADEPLPSYEDTQPTTGARRNGRRR